MTIEPKPVSRPLSVAQFSDGKAYELPALQFSQPHLFSKIAFMDQIVVKLPSSRGLSDYQKFIKYEQADHDDIRRNEPLERFSNIERLVAKYPRFRPTLETCGADTAHYLLVHRLQCERLMGSRLIIPDTRFVVQKKVFMVFFSRWIPTLIQARVHGTALWDMYDHELDQLRPEWSPFKAAISAILNDLLCSDLRDHINWNIENLLFDKDANRLYYVDLKPSTMFSRSHNDHNIASIQEVFIDTHGPTRPHLHHRDKHPMERALLTALDLDDAEQFDEAADILRAALQQLPTSDQCDSTEGQLRFRALVSLSNVTRKGGHAPRKELDHLNEARKLVHFAPPRKDGPDHTYNFAYILHMNRGVAASTIASYDQSIEAYGEALQTARDPVCRCKCIAYLAWDILKQGIESKSQRAWALLDQFEREAENNAIPDMLLALAKHGRAVQSLYEGNLAPARLLLDHSLRLCPADSQVRAVVEYLRKPHPSASKAAEMLLATKQAVRPSGPDSRVQPSLPPLREDV